MSRLARKPIVIPEGVEFKKNGDLCVVKGKLGQFEHQLHASVRMSQSDKTITLEPVKEHPMSEAMLGTSTKLLMNYIQGVSEGFSKKLQLLGVGYRAKVSGKNLELTLGFSHPVVYAIPEGISIECPSNTEIVVQGKDKQIVGHVAHKIRSYRPPESYKGKGVRYADEVVHIKETKKK